MNSKQLLTILLLLVISMIFITPIAVYRAKASIYLSNHERVFCATLTMSSYVGLATNKSNESSSFYFYIYGSYECPHCRAMKRYFAEWYGEEHVFFCSIKADRECAQRFLEIYKALHLKAAIPIIIVIKNNSVISIVQGEVRDRGFWDRILALNPSKNISIYLGHSLAGYVVVEDIIKFSKSVAPEVVGMGQPAKLSLLIEEVHVEHLSGLGGLVTEFTEAKSNIVILLVALALADAVNPCTLYIYTLLLIAAALAASCGMTMIRSEIIKKPLICGIAFIIAIYVGYLALGLGLTSALHIIAGHTWIFGIVAIAFGLWTIATGLAEKSRVLAKGTILDLLHRASASPILSFALGLLLTFTLLPCSAGPYVVFTGLLTEFPIHVAIGYLMLYNLVFVSPLIAILLVAVITMKMTNVQRFIIEHSKKLSVFAGMLLVFIGLYIVFQL